METNVNLAAIAIAIAVKDSDEEPQTDSSGESEFEVECGGGSDSSDSEAGTAEEKLSRIIGERLDQAGLGFQLDSATADLTARSIGSVM